MGLIISLMLVTDGRHTDVWVTILALDSDLDTVFLGYLFCPAKTPCKAVDGFFFGDPFTGSPFRTVVVPTKAFIS
jgi:hypothetical protein